MITKVSAGRWFIRQTLQRLLHPATSVSSQIRQVSVNGTPVDEANLRDIVKKITIQTTTTLVPEIQLHLITPQCSLWNSPPEDCPVEDPYWAFFWPGGQALCRYLLDNPGICKQKNVLDIGSGSGASAIAAATCNAKLVVANDIDPVANLAMKMNIDLNEGFGTLVKTIKFHPSDILPESRHEPLEKYWHLQNLLSSNSGNGLLIDVILVGDMCYDEAIARRLLLLLRALRCINPDICILLGDPGRHCFPIISEQFHAVHEYSMTQSTECNSWGFPSSYVYRLKS